MMSRRPVHRPGRDDAAAPCRCGWGRWSLPRPPEAQPAARWDVRQRLLGLRREEALSSWPRSPRATSTSENAGMYRWSPSWRARASSVTSTWSRRQRPGTASSRPGGRKEPRPPRIPAQGRPAAPGTSTTDEAGLGCTRGPWRTGTSRGSDGGSPPKLTVYAWQPHTVDGAVLERATIAQVPDPPRHLPGGRRPLEDQGGRQHAGAARRDGGTGPTTPRRRLSGFPAAVA